MRGAIEAWAVAAIVSIVCCSMPALAAPPMDADRVAAGALYDLALKRMADDEYDAACRLLEESLGLYLGTGTIYQLGKCYEHVGRTASAWRQFLLVAERARADKQPERAADATKQADALAPNLMKIVVTVPDEALAPGLEIRVDGEVLDRSRWNVPEPFDPGKHGVQASAKGKQTWQRAVEARPEPNVGVVHVPILRDTVEIYETVGASSPPEPEAPAPGVDTQRVVGLTVLGVGGLATTVGVVLAWTASSDHADALDLCGRELSCNTRAGQLRDDVKDGAVATTLVLVGGASAIAAGAILLLFPETPAPTSARITPAVGPGTASLSLTTRW